MRKILDDGLKLFTVSTAYILLSSVYFSFLWHSRIAMQLGTIIGIGFLGLWFYYGLKLKMGFIKGLMVGLMGAAGGILLAGFSLVMVLKDLESAFWFMIPWTYPFVGIFEVIPYPGVIDNYLPHISVIIVVVLTALGSWAGKARSCCSRMNG